MYTFVLHSFQVYDVKVREESRIVQTMMGLKTPRREPRGRPKKTTPSGMTTDFAVKSMSTVTPNRQTGTAKETSSTPSKQVMTVIETITTPQKQAEPVEEMSNVTNITLSKQIGSVGETSNSPRITKSKPTGAVDETGIMSSGQIRTVAETDSATSVEASKQTESIAMGITPSKQSGIGEETVSATSNTPSRQAVSAEEMDPDEAGGSPTLPASQVDDKKDSSQSKGKPGGLSGSLPCLPEAPHRSAINDVRVLQGADDRVAGNQMAAADNAVTNQVVNQAESNHEENVDNVDMESIGSVDDIGMASVDSDEEWQPPGTVGDMQTQKAAGGESTGHKQSEQIPDLLGTPVTSPVKSISTPITQRQDRESTETLPSTALPFQTRTAQAKPASILGTLPLVSQPVIPPVSTPQRSPEKVTTSPPETMTSTSLPVIPMTMQPVPKPHTHTPQAVTAVKVVSESSSTKVMHTSTLEAQQTPVKPAPTPRSVDSTSQPVTPVTPAMVSNSTIFTTPVVRRVISHTNPAPVPVALHITPEHGTTSITTSTSTQATTTSLISRPLPGLPQTPQQPYPTALQVASSMIPTTPQNNPLLAQLAGAMQQGGRLQPINSPVGAIQSNVLAGSMMANQQNMIVVGSAPVVPIFIPGVGQVYGFVPGSMQLAHAGLMSSPVGVNNTLQQQTPGTNATGAINTTPQMMQAGISPQIVNALRSFNAQQLMPGASILPAGVAPVGNVQSMVTPAMASKAIPSASISTPLAAANTLQVSNVSVRTNANIQQVTASSQPTTIATQSSVPAPSAATSVSEGVLSSKATSAIDAENPSPAVPSSKQPPSVGASLQEVTNEQSDLGANLNISQEQDEDYPQESDVEDIEPEPADTSSSLSSAIPSLNDDTFTPVKQEKRRRRRRKKAELNQVNTSLSMCLPSLDGQPKGLSSSLPRLPRATPSISSVAKVLWLSEQEANATTIANSESVSFSVDSGRSNEGIIDSADDLNDNLAIDEPIDDNVPQQNALETNSPVPLTMQTAQALGKPAGAVEQCVTVNAPSVAVIGDGSSSQAVAVTSHASSSYTAHTQPTPTTYSSPRFSQPMTTSQTLHQSQQTVLYPAAHSNNTIQNVTQTVVKPCATLQPLPTVRSAASVHSQGEKHPGTSVLQNVNPAVCMQSAIPTQIATNTGKRDVVHVGTLQNNKGPYKIIRIIQQPNAISSNITNTTGNFPRVTILRPGTPLPPGSNATVRNMLGIHAPVRGLLQQSNTTVRSMLPLNAPVLQNVIGRQQVHMLRPVTSSQTILNVPTVTRSIPSIVSQGVTPNQLATFQLRTTEQSVPSAVSQQPITTLTVVNPSTSSAPFVLPQAQRVPFSLSHPPYRSSGSLSSFLPNVNSDDESPDVQRMQAVKTTLMAKIDKMAENLLGAQEESANNNIPLLPPNSATLKALKTLLLHRRALEKRTSEHSGNDLPKKKFKGYMTNRSEQEVESEGGSAETKTSKISDQPSLHHILDTPDFKRLQERFMSVFAWPALLSTIPPKSKQKPPRGKGHRISLAESEKCKKKRSRKRSATEAHVESEETVSSKVARPNNDDSDTTAT